MTRTGPRLGPALDSSKAKVSAQCERRALDSGTREHLPPAFAAFDTRIHHKLIAAAKAACSDAPAANYKAISKSAAECIGGAGAFLAVVAITH